MANVYPGSWIFNRITLSWLSNPTLRKQLPLLHKIFASYSKFYFANNQKEYLKNGRTLFLWVVKLNKLFSSKKNMDDSHLKLELPNYEIYLDPCDPRFFQVVSELHDEVSDTRILAKLLSQGDTFIDLGANHGSFSVVASKLLGSSGRIVAVEPQPYLAKAIQKSLTANSKCSFSVFQTAVGNKQGNIELLIPKDTSGSAGQYAGHSATHDHRTISVPIQKFDDLTDWQNFPGKVLVKLDVEGSECEVLEGAKQMMMTLMPTLILEVHPGSLKASGRTGQGLKELLQDLDYKTYAELSDIDKKDPIADLDMNRQRNVVLYH